MDACVCTANGNSLNLHIHPNYFFIDIIVIEITSANTTIITTSSVDDFCFAFVIFPHTTTTILTCKNYC